jgi:hypothetical protein
VPLISKKSEGGLVFGWNWAKIISMKFSDSGKTRAKRPSAEGDPSIRLNISMPESEHRKLTTKAEQRGVSLSRLLAESALSNEEVRAMPTKDVIPWQEQKIKEEFKNQCDVWVFGGAGPKFPFTEQETSEKNPISLMRIWQERAMNGIHHHVFWDVDLADLDGMMQFCTKTFEVAKQNSEKGARGKIIHHGITVGKVYEEKIDFYQGLIHRVGRDQYGTSLIIHPMFDLCEATSSDVDCDRTAAREARWLCRFGEMGSLVAVLPRNLDQRPSASLLHDSLSVLPDQKPMELWLWLESKESRKLAYHVDSFLRNTQRDNKNGE